MPRRSRGGIAAAVGGSIEVHAVHPDPLTLAPDNWTHIRQLHGCASPFRPAVRTTACRVHRHDSHERHDRSCLSPRFDQPRLSVTSWRNAHSLGGRPKGLARRVRELVCGSRSASSRRAGRTESRGRKLRPVTIFTGAALLACRGHETKVPRPSYISPPDSSDIGVLRTLALRHSCGIGPDFWGVRQIHGSRARELPADRGA